MDAQADGMAGVRRLSQILRQLAVGIHKKLAGGQKVRIPDAVRIGGVDYSIIHVPNLRDGSRLLYGEISDQDCEIHLSATDGMGHERKCITLIHEILHGIANHAELEIADEERVITVLARGVYQVLKDNPAMFADSDKEGDA